MLAVLKRLWVPLIVTIAVLLGSVGVLYFRGMFGSDKVFVQPEATEAIVSVNVKEVTYEIFGPPNTTGGVSYLNEYAESQNVRFTSLPWTQTLTTTIPAVVAQVVAQGDSDNIGCRITVNGVVKDEQSASGHNVQTFCLVKAA